MGNGFQNQTRLTHKFLNYKIELSFSDIDPFFNFHNSSMCCQSGLEIGWETTCMIELMSILKTAILKVLASAEEKREGLIQIESLEKTGSNRFLGHSCLNSFLRERKSYFC